MAVAVFCSAEDVDEVYVRAVKKLGQLFAQNKFTLIWGGTNKGMMKVIADSVQENGGKLIGITTEMFKANRRLNADQMIITLDHAERKKTFLAKADAFMLLVGGIGSMDEITEILEFKKHGIHHKPIVVLNTAGFYSGLKTQLTRMEKEHFLPRQLKDLITFAATPSQAIRLLRK
ncbi:MAG: TIGR00730 family Rossman fold protein [Candidatus Chisholmbacteria bacterium]|nr:TIGR00730 family Rossman fold protein [Candidatus Chisholmbacteria bacterium]